MASNPRQPVGWSWGALYYTPYFGDYWHTPGLTGTLRQTASELQQTAERANKLLEDPSPFIEKAVRGAITGATTRASAEPRGEEEVDLDRMDPPSLVDRVQRLITEGASKAAIVGLEKILLHAQTEDLELRDSALEALNQARHERASLTETAQGVWESLNSRHIVWGGVNLNAQRSSNKDLREIRLELDKKEHPEESRLPDTDGMTPIDSLIRCQEFYQTLRIEHHLPPAPGQIPSSSEPSLSPEMVETDAPPSPSSHEMQALVRETDKTIKQFCDKTIHYSTMYAMSSLFSQNIEAGEFKRMLKNGGDLQAAYLQRAGGGAVRQFIYKHTYNLILKLVGSIIRETIEGVTSNLREFLNDDVQMLKFAEAKIGDLSRYYGRIERGRKDYCGHLNHEHPGYEAGSFDEFLSMTMQTYGENRLTEAELIKRFGDYIVANYAPRPRIEIRGYRIPLLSKALEWIVHGIRKALIRFFLRRTRLVDTILTQGTGSAFYAQLGLKTMLQTKLRKIIEMIQRSRPRSVTELSSGKDSARLRLEAKKAQLITRDLHLVIQQHSHNLHRFIAIQAANNNREALADLDNRVDTLTRELLGSLTALFQWEPLSLQGVLEDATTNLLETSLLSLFEDKERQIESQMQGIFEMLDKAFDYTDQEEAQRIELRYRNDLRSVNKNLEELLEQLSRLAIEAAVEDHLKNASVERHQKIKEFVEEEKEEALGLALCLQETSEGLSAIFINYDAGTTPIDPVKEQLNEAIARIEAYLRRTAVTLRGNALKRDCYSDVRGDLYNAYAIFAQILQGFAVDVLDPLLKEIEEIERQERLVERYSEARVKIEALSSDLRTSELEEELKGIRELIPQSDREEMSGYLNAIKEGWNGLDKINKQQRLLDRLSRAKKEHAALKRQIDQLGNVRRQLEELSNLLSAYRSSGSNEANAGQRGELTEEIQRRYEQIMRISDPSLHQHVLDLLVCDETDALYQKLHPSWPFRQKTPVFAALESYQMFLHTSMTRNLERQRVLEAQTEGLSAEHIQSEKEELIVAIGGKIHPCVDSIAHQEMLLRRALKCRTESLTEFAKKFPDMAWEIGMISDELKVNGFIAVGELQLSQNITPLVATIAPRISESITNLLDSLGKPFHYKQLILRLVLLDIVKRNES